MGSHLLRMLITQSAYPTQEPSAAHMGEYGSSDIIQRQNFIYRAGLDRFFRHAEHDTARFILSDREGAGLLHCQHFFGAVVPHPGEYHPDSVGASISGY